MSKQREGVIQYRLEFEAGEPPPDSEALRRLSGWRSLLRRLGLVGQQPDRYQGYGYGNLSIRDGTEFLITGTQTGSADWLPPEGYARVQSVDLARNRVVASGAVQPSSEALTHAAIYALHSEVAAVLHVHSPEIFQAADRLDLAQTPASVPYGTPAMAEAVARVHRDQGWQAEGVLVMAGHEDGVIAFAAELDRAGALLLRTLARAVDGAGQGPDKGPD